jgi:hypothetical protein
MSVQRKRVASIRVISVTAFSAALWMLFAKYVVPSLITDAYHGQSAPYINSLISGQSVHPLSDYIVSWDTMSLRILMALLVCGIGAIVLVQPGMQEIVWGESRERARSADIARPRMVAIYALLAMIAIGSAVSIVRGTDYWPFSNYPMYSYAAKGNELSEYRLYGVTEQGKEFSLTQYAYTQPFDNARVNVAFENLRKHCGEQGIRSGLWDFLRRYETARALGQHDGPQLQGLKLYKVTWTLDPLARNVDQPDALQLVSEVRADEDAIHR